HFAADYSKHSLLGFVGLPLLALVALINGLNRNKKELFFFAALIIHPLILVNMRPTNIFVSDTYLLLPLLGLGIFLGTGPGIGRNWFTYTLIALAGMMGLKTFSETKIAT